MKSLLLSRGITLSLILWGGLAVSCSDSKKEKEETVETVLPVRDSEVTTQVLKKTAFYHELVSNGKVKAGRYADLTFGSVQPIAHIFVKNGMHVRRGQKLAELDLFKLRNAVEQVKSSMEQAKLEMQDVLIGQGFNPEKSKNIPADVMKLAGVKSGYEQSKAQYELAVYEMNHAVLTAPFDGVVANLFSQPFTMASTTEAFCRIINESEMEVDFKVLENELSLIKTGDKVVVAPFSSSGGETSGVVVEINPLVDENGMVSVKARLRSNGKFFDGMNVRVSVRRSIKNVLVIPKSAVVLRSAKQVVFTLKDGKAMWNYVTTGLENMDSYIVNERQDGNSTDGLSVGDVVIVTGNVNLAHESPVKVISTKKD